MQYGLNYITYYIKEIIRIIQTINEIISIEDFVLQGKGVKEKKPINFYSTNPIEILCSTTIDDRFNFTEILIKTV